MLGLLLTPLPGTLRCPLPWPPACSSPARRHGHAGDGAAQSSACSWPDDRGAWLDGLRLRLRHRHAGAAERRHPAAPGSSPPGSAAAGSSWRGAALRQRHPRHALSGGLRSSPLAGLSGTAVSAASCPPTSPACRALAPGDARPRRRPRHGGSSAGSSWWCAAGFAIQGFRLAMGADRHGHGGPADDPLAQPLNDRRRRHRPGGGAGRRRPPAHPVPRLPRPLLWCLFFGFFVCGCMLLPHGTSPASSIPAACPLCRRRGDSLIGLFTTPARCSRRAHPALRRRELLVGIYAARGVLMRSHAHRKDHDERDDFSAIMACCGCPRCRHRRALPAHGARAGSPPSRLSPRPPDRRLHGAFLGC